jgi:dTMP kinase
LRHRTSAGKLNFNVKTAGKLIAIEGIDGSGKRTQVEMLGAALTADGFRPFVTGFPVYESWFGKMIGQFLNGDLGPLETVDPHFTAMLYAGDRFEAKERLTQTLEEGRVLLADRYIASNLAHQTARVTADHRTEFIAWIEHLEYEIYGLPHPDLTIYLRVPASEAQKLVELKSSRSYTNAKKDLQESNLRHLEQAAAIYDSLSRREGWATVECFDNGRRKMRERDEIAADVMTAVRPMLVGSLSSHSAKDRG